MREGLKHLKELCASDTNMPLLDHAKRFLLVGALTKMTHCEDIVIMGLEVLSTQASTGLFTLVILL